MELGDKIKNIRLINRMSQEEFAKELGISRSSLINYEKGVRNPRLDVLVNICERFNIKFEELQSDDSTINHMLEKIDNENILPYKKTENTYLKEKTQKAPDNLILETFKYYINISGYAVNSLVDDEIEILHKKVQDFLNFEFYKKKHTNT